MRVREVATLREVDVLLGHGSSPVVAVSWALVSARVASASASALAVHAPLVAEQRVDEARTRENGRSESKKVVELVSR